MRIWTWLVLTFLTFTVGCAQGYYDSRPAYREPGATVNWTQNPETEGEYEMRLWQEDVGSH